MTLVLVTSDGKPYSLSRLALSANFAIAQDAEGKETLDFSSGSGITIAFADARYVLKTGDTMTGPLTVGHTDNVNTLVLAPSHASYAGATLRPSVTRAASSAFYFFYATANSVEMGWWRGDGALSTTSYIRSTGTYGWAMGELSGAARIRYGAAAGSAFDFLTTANALADIYTRDVIASRGDGTGVIYLNAAGNRYLYYSGTGYIMPGANLELNGQVVLHAGNYNSYAPTLTGTGASGTWGISISGDAGSVDGYSAAEAATGSTVLARNASGYAFAVYFNSTDDASSNPVTGLMGKFGDNYLRTATAARAATFVQGGATGSWGISVTGTSSNITAYTINQNVGTSNAPTFNGVYTNDWFRINGNKEGLYNETDLLHFYSDRSGDSAWWNVAGASTDTSGYIAMRVGAVGGAIKGYLYWGSTGFGLLDSAGAYRVRTTTSGGELSGAWSCTSTLTATNFILSSDIRFKTDVRPLQDSLNRICAVQTIRYRSIDDPSRERAGVVAQQIAEHIPECVFDIDGVLKVDYDQLIPHLIDAVRELAFRGT